MANYLVFLGKKKHNLKKVVANREKAGHSEDSDGLENDDNQG